MHCFIPAPLPRRLLVDTCMGSVAFIAASTPATLQRGRWRPIPRGPTPSAQPPRPPPPAEATTLPPPPAPPARAQAIAAITTLNGADLGGRRVLVREDREDRDVKQADGAATTRPARVPRERAPRPERPERVENSSGLQVGGRRGAGGVGGATLGGRGHRGARARPGSCTLLELVMLGAVPGPQTGPGGELVLRAPRLLAPDVACARGHPWCPADCCARHPLELHLEGAEGHVCRDRQHRARRRGVRRGRTQQGGCWCG